MNKIWLFFVLIVCLRIDFMRSSDAVVDFSLNDFIVKRVLANQDFVQGFDAIGRGLDDFVRDVTLYLPAARKNALIATGLESKEEIEIALDQELQDRIKKHSSAFTTIILERLSIQNLFVVQDERKYFENLIESYIESECLLINVVDALAEQTILDFIVRPFLKSFITAVKKKSKFKKNSIFTYVENAFKVDNLSDDERDKLWIRIEVESHLKVCLDENGNTLLHQAFYQPNLNILKFLIDTKIDLNLQNGDQQTPLHVAFEIGNNEIIELLISALIEMKEDLNIPDYDGRTPLYYAIETNNQRIIELLIPPLIKANINFNSAYLLAESPLHHAIEKNNERAIELLFPILIERNNLNKVDRYGKTLLDRAIENNNPKVIEFLISSFVSFGVSLDSPDNYGWTPLNYAIKRYNRKAVNLLIEAGVSIDHLNDEEQSILRVMMCMRFVENLYRCFSSKNRIVPIIS